MLAFCYSRSLQCSSMLTLTYTPAFYIKVVITAVESFIEPAPSLSSAARALNSILQ
jgi:hypothetical protein